MFIPGAQGDKHINFYNIYIVVRRRVYRQAGKQCTVIGEVLWGPEKDHNSKAGCA
jgi:hypothetical protein